MQDGNKGWDRSGMGTGSVERRAAACVDVQSSPGLVNRAYV